MGSLKGMLSGNKPPLCHFCSQKKLSENFWEYWSHRALNFSGSSRAFKTIFMKELSGCAACWQDVHLKDRNLNGRLKQYISGTYKSIENESENHDSEHHDTKA